MPLSTSDATGGSTLTRDQVVATLIQPLETESVVLRAGPRLFTAEGGAPVRIPKLTVYPIGGIGASPTDPGPWVAENGLIPDIDPEFDEVVLLPSTLKSLKLITRWSSEMSRHAVVDIANALRTSLVAKFALALDRAFLLGDGAANTITGIVNMPGVQEFEYDILTVDDLIVAEGMALAANARPSAWLLHPAAWTTLQRQRENGTDGGYLLQPDATAAGTWRLRGLPAFPTTQLPEGTVILVDASQVAVARDVDAAVTILTERWAEYDQIAIRIVSRWDIGALNAEGIVVLTP